MPFFTYSIFPGTPQESISSNNLLDLLSALPDNTNKLITPRDVRDAVFSSWENTVFRFTKNTSGTDYIGISRGEVKGDKIYIGKKNLGGSDIMTNSLLGSNTDIFIYNTKLDTAPNQDLEIRLLGGSPSLHVNAPFIRVQQVAGLTPSLSLTIGHNQSFGGNINITAGQFGRVGINNLIIPSQSEINNMVSGPTGSLPGDLYLVRSGSGFIELREAGTVFSNLGSPNTPTGIVGSPVTVNGFSLEFSDPNPMIGDFRGFSQGETFSNVPIIEMIRGILYPELGPLTTISTGVNVFERNHLSGTNVAYNYSLTKRSYDILTSDIEIVGDVTIAQILGPVLTGPGFQTNTYSDAFLFSNVDIQSNLSGRFTFSYLATDVQSNQSPISEFPIDFVWPYFFGFSATTSNSQSIVNGAIKLVNVKGDQFVPLSGVGFLSFFYPNDYGDLSEIVDSNGFQIWQFGQPSTSWTYSVVTINSPSGIWSGKSYKWFRTLNEVSIPLPSELYGFKF